MPDVPRLLVLGGSSFVDRAIVEDAVSRGCRVTTFNRGRGPWSHPDPDHLIGTASSRPTPNGSGAGAGISWLTPGRVLQDHHR